MKEKKNKKGKYAKARKIVLGILLVYIAVLLVIYAAGVFYFSKHFFLGARINGADCSGKTVKSVEDSIADEIAAYALTIKERGENTEVITASGIELNYVEDNKIQELMDAQNPFIWFLSFAEKNDHTMSATTAYNEEKLIKVIEGLNCFAEENIQQPEDAHLEMGENGYEIVPETEGNALDPEKTTAIIREAIQTGKTEINLETEECYLTPSVYKNDEKLIAQRDQSNAYLNVTITFDFSDRKEVVDKNVIKNWLITDDSGNVALNEEKVKEYVVAMAKEYDTFGYPREFKTSYGETITVRGGDYGWLIARNDTTAKLIEAIKSGQSQTMEPEYTYKGYVRDTNDIGNTYVEISLARQHMWFYKNGQLIVDTDVVTGNHNEGLDTHTGIYAIMYKERDATLVGENYSSPVKYWMPFYANTGIHDASWRTVFGGNEYINNGSHGCVNTPEANAEKIFNNIEKGVPVIVYDNQ